jgi:quinoprotein glucose dehydrogenase
MPTKPPPFDRQGFSNDDLIDFTPELKARAVEIAKHYRMGPLHTPPALINQEKGPWGSLILPGTQGGANWTGGAYDPDTGILYIYSKTAVEALGVVQGPDGKLAQKGGGIPPNTNDNNGGAFGGTAGLTGGSPGLGGPTIRGGDNKMTGPIVPGLSIEGLCLSKPPYGRISAIDLRKGEIKWWSVHGETPDFIKNHPLLKGVNIPRTGQSGILGTLATKSLVVCGDGGLFTDETGRKAARLRAYDKATGKEVGSVVLEKSQTGTPITYMLDGRQYIVLAIGGVRGAELIAYRLPDAVIAAGRKA